MGGERERNGIDSVLALDIGDRVYNARWTHQCYASNTRPSDLKIASGMFDVKVIDSRGALLKCSTKNCLQEQTIDDLRTWNKSEPIPEFLNLTGLPE